MDGLGSTGGFKLQVQDRGDSGPDALQAAADRVVEQGNADPGLEGLYTSYRARTAGR